MLAKQPQLRRGPPGACVNANGLYRDHSTATLEVSAANIAAIQLYMQLGFHIDGRRRAYYGKHDAILMRRGSQPLS